MDGRLLPTAGVLASRCLARKNRLNRSDADSLYTASVRLSLDTPDPQTAAAAGANADTARAIVTSPGLVARALAAAGVPNVSEESSTEFAERDVKVQGLGSANVIQLSVTYPEARTAALIANQLQVFIDGENSHFRIEKSLRSSLLEVYRKLFT